MAKGSQDTRLKNLNLPEFTADRCVHAHISNASCCACIDVCHADAWQLEDGSLAIDSERCDGCGVCAAICPESAVYHPHNPLSIAWRGELIAMVACERLTNKSASMDEGVINCIHALSLTDLLKLQLAEHKRLLIATAECEECTRKQGMILDSQLIRFNELLDKRGETQLERVDVSEEQWRAILSAATPENTGKRFSRRKFLRRAVSEISEYGLIHFDLNPAEQAAPRAVGRLLNDKEGVQVFPYIPEIDVQQCNACSTCFRLCPHQALRIAESGGGYDIDAPNCTGCMICVDVCEENAIDIKQNTVFKQKRIALYPHKCVQCGVTFSSLETAPVAMCSVCQKKPQNKLFQVLD